MVILNYETKNDFGASAVPKAYNIKSFVYGHFICVCCRVGFGDDLIFFKKLEAYVLYVIPFLMIKQCAIHIKHAILVFISLILTFGCNHLKSWNYCLFTYSLHYI